MDSTLESLLNDYNEPWLSEFEDLVARALNSATNINLHKVAASDLVAAARYLLGSELNAVSIRTHLELLSEQNEDLGTYGEWVTSQAGRAQVAATYPELERIFAYKVSQLAELITSVVQRFDHDLPALRSKGFNVDAQLVGLEITSGDPHQGGQRVCILNTGAPGWLIVNHGRGEIRPAEIMISAGVPIGLVDSSDPES